MSLPSGPVHLSQYLRGYENWLVDMVTDRRFFDALLDRCLQWWLELAGPVLDAAGSAVDVVMFGDDVAFHDRPMVDLKRHREIFKPRHRQMVDLIKRKTGAKVLYHCCGAVRKLVPDFIDMGIDALNPVQVSSAGMDTAELKAEYGRDVCFWGGIDTQHVMPHGAPGDVYSEVERRIRDLAPGGGYVLAAVHNLQDDVPPENILAMADAAREYGA